MSILSKIGQQALHVGVRPAVSAFQVSTNLRQLMSSTSSFATRALSSQCGCNKNQTLEDSMNVFVKNRQALGTGMFLVPAPEKGILESKVVLVENLTYDDSVKRGENCSAVKWVAQDVLSFADLEAARVKCRDHWCGPNRDWCPTGCVCGSGNYCF